MTTYKAYWRDDPVFDATNTQAHAPHLPCPTLDRGVLLMLCRFAIENNFWSSPLPDAPPQFDVLSFLQLRLRRTAPADYLRREPETTMNLTVNGPGGGEWRLRFDGQQCLCDVALGSIDGGIANVITSVDCLRSLEAGEVTSDNLLKGGGIVVENVLVPSADLSALLNSAFASSPESSGA